MNRYNNYYPLILPKLHEVRNPEFNLNLAMEVLKNGIARFPPEKVFNKHILDLLQRYGIYPSVAVLLYTGPDHIGTPHIDGANSETGSWSINWNVGANMILNYYKSDEFIDNYKLASKDGKRDYLLIKDRNLEKTETYSPESPFILRTDSPHSVINLESTKRWAFTLRGLPKNTWEEIIDLLTQQNLIKY